jgi:phage gpG-like protein
MNGRYAVEVGVFGSRAKIAKVHEFGKTIEVTDKMRNYLHWKGLHLNPKTTTIKIPERSFMRSAHQENLRQIKKIVRGK